MSTGIEWDDETFQRVLERLRTEGTIKAEGMHISRERLGRILGAAPQAPYGDDLPMLRDADFHGAQFSSNAVFSEVQFSGRTDFGEAEFLSNAVFEGARFSGSAIFVQALFSGHPGFREAEFSGDAVFTGARFRGDADFVEAQFSGNAVFARAQFSGDAGFREAEFSGDSDFGGAQFSGDASFIQAAFRRRARLGPIVVARTLYFDQTALDEDVELSAAAGQLSCQGTRFGGRADLNLRWAEVALDGATFVQRSRLAGVGPFPNIDDSQASACRVDRRLDAQARPRVLSLRQANVENLALGNVDLRACRFFGAHGLDQLRVEADCDFAQPPRRRYLRRRTLAEEHHWRAAGSLEERIPHEPSEEPPAGSPSGRQGTGGWHPPECQPAAWLEQEAKAEVLDPPRIASLYRLLRKALEDRKDEPGAADFYYGEMEMRRAAGRPWPERLLLHAYWAVSGYGLTAARAALCLTLAVVGGALLLDWFGFRPDRAFGRSLLFGVESSISLLRAPQANLTAGGEVVQIALRLLGPLFLGLTLLALRGRVKR